MDSYQVDFRDLIGMRKINQVGLLVEVFTDWAEKQVSNGNTSTNILILASLGLDKDISKDEVFCTSMLTCVKLV